MAYGVVVIGSSLGGLHAVSTLLAALPKAFHLPIVIAQHRATAPPPDCRAGDDLLRRARRDDLPAHGPAAQHPTRKLV